MLTVGQSHSVKFKVNVMGTSADPRVRVILGTSPELSFAASKEGDDWSTNLQVPAHVEPGDYDMRVEVHLNNRLFTPINKKINVAPPVKLDEPVHDHESEQAQEIKFVAPSTTVAPPAVAPRTSIPNLFAGIAADKSLDKKPAPPAPRFAQVAPKEPVYVPSVEELLPPAPGLSALERVAKAPAKRRFEAISSGMPSKPIDAKPITVKISEIDAASSKKVSRTVEAKVSAPAKVVKPKATSNVKLIKENLFYE